MELQFEKTSLAFLDRTLNETRGQEVTAEVIVPDSFPDAERILCTSASCVLRGKECRTGSIILSGGIRASTLYVPEDGSWARPLDAYIPFSVRIDHPSAGESMQVLSCCAVRQADARLLNSRKILFRVSIGCTVQGFEARTEELCTLKDKPEQLEIRTQSYPLRLPLMTAEKPFVMTEDVELGAGEPPVTQIVSYTTVPEITDRKIVGARAVFKGELALHVLYQTAEHALMTLSRRIPFSQYCDLPEDADGDAMDAWLCVTGAELEAEDGGARLVLSVSLAAQCLVTGTRTVELIEDAYAVGAALDAKWQELRPRCILDRQTQSMPLRQQINAEAAEIICCRVYADAPAQQRTDAGVRITAPLHIYLLYRDASGALQCAHQHAECVYETALAAGAQCSVCVTVPECAALLSAGGAEVRAEVRFELEFTSDQTLRTLCGGTIDEAAAEESRPSVILRVCPAGTALWELAKEYAARAESIAGANHLTGDTVPEEMLLLIPM